MAREDLYAGGLAAGATVAGTGALVASSGNRMRQQGRAQARANAGSRGEGVRGGRLVRAGQQIVDEGNKELKGMARVGSNGKTVYIKPTGGFAPTKKIRSGIDQGKATSAEGRAQSAAGKARRPRAVAGLKQMRRGRLVARGGFGLAAIGGLAALGSVAAGERYRSGRVKAIDLALNPPKSAPVRPDRAAEIKALAPKRPREGFRPIVENPATGKLTVVQSARVKAYDDAWRKQIGDWE